MRIWIAAAVGGLAAFMTAAAFEWVWEMAAIAVRRHGARRGDRRRARRAASRPTTPATASAAFCRASLVALLAVVALGAVAVPMAGALATRDSRDAAADGRLAAALEDSRTAERLQPYAATPHLQQALVLEQAGALAARGRGREGGDRRRADELAHVVRARAHRGAARRGRRPRCARCARRRRLNPRSPLLGAR